MKGVFSAELHMAFICLNVKSPGCAVVDVVRTDNHLEFYEDSKNMARMSDILAVYAWVDPATGYCQGLPPHFVSVS